MTSQSEDAVLDDGGPQFYVRPLKLTGKGVDWNWLDVPMDDATHWGVGFEPTGYDELITVLPAFEAAESAVERLNKILVLLAARKS